MPTKTQTTGYSDTCWWSTWTCSCAAARSSAIALRPDGAGQDSTVAGPTTGALPVSLSEDLGRTRAALVAEVYQRLATLPPETRTVVMANLGTINQALDDL